MPDPLKCEHCTQRLDTDYGCVKCIPSREKQKHHTALDTKELLYEALRIQKDALSKIRSKIDAMEPDMSTMRDYSEAVRTLDKVSGAIKGSAAELRQWEDRA